MHNAAPLQSAASYVEDIIAVGNSFCSIYVKDFLSVKNISIVLKHTTSNLSVCI